MLRRWPFTGWNSFKSKVKIWQNLQSGCAPSEDSDPPSLIRVFAVRMEKPWVFSYPLSTQRRLIRLGGCPGWSESSLGARSFCWFCHIAAQIRWLLSKVRVKILYLQVKIMYIWCWRLRCGAEKPRWTTLSKASALEVTAVGSLFHWVRIPVSLCDTYLTYMLTSVTQHSHSAWIHCSSC